uniref:C-factor n=1 Tax=Varanus komodoensis TaxID=61221 RepID=A0A8D2IWJ3_VARKO
HAMPTSRAVLVTGANRGIGLELVRQLAGGPDAPRWIFACCREPDGVHGQVLSSHPNLVIVKLDVTNHATIKAAATYVEDHLEDTGLNLLINNAGVLAEVALETVAPQDMLNGYNSNVVGPLLVSQAFLPLLRRAAQGSIQKGLSCSRAAIINISTVLGSIGLAPHTFVKHVISYRCSKAALNMLTKCQSLDYKEDGILCAAVHPGWVKTDMGTQQADLTVDESVRGILSVLSRFGDEHNGAFVNWKGETIPW